MSLLYLTFLFPLLGWLLLAFSLGRLGERTSALIGVGSIGLSALTTLWVGIDFLNTMPEGGVYTQTLWQWMTVGEFQPAFRLSLDGLSLTMLGVVTGVGFFIHLFASWYMRGEEGYSRFFTYTNLFIASMLFLVLADDLLFVYLGWEGVGLCSYLLIGFYYKDRNNGAAALKAFVVTRVGDVFLAIGLFVLYRELGTLNIHELLVRAPAMFAEGSPALSFACLMLLGGAVGKSAQLPLQTWLADAMAGPTPVSALIHAATMVTAGVYLIARTHGLFLLAPEILHLVALVGAITLVLAGFAALVQTDIKRILAYSTMSQIGYMFLALGVGAWEGAIFHLMTHAFFKALLFLSAGAVIVATHHEQNIFKMGGLRKSLPLVYACFLVGGSALAALPLVTAGFYSKDAILWQVQASGQSALLWAGLGGFPDLPLHLPPHLHRLPRQGADPGARRTGPCPPSATAGAAGALHRRRRPHRATTGRSAAGRPGRSHRGGSPWPRDPLRRHRRGRHCACRLPLPRRTSPGEGDRRECTGAGSVHPLVQCLGL